MEYLRIRNWERWQTYRKDRGQPPWIKIHRRIRLNPDWVELSDAERGQLVAIWLLAADKDGAIPASPSTIQKLCFMTKEPNLNKFTDLGFIEEGWRPGDAGMAPGRQPDVTPKAKAKAEAEAEAEESEYTLSSSEPEKIGSGGRNSCPQKEILQLYHEILPSLPIIREWPVHLQKRLRARWKESDIRQSLDWWNKYFRFISESTFLMGKDTDFQVDLEWIIGPRNMTKILNGRYHKNKYSGIDEWLKIRQERRQQNGSMQ
uniref:Uncharacterized protein n=1 Tax=viral metagenome TaxID=1070528 RepID=A0A6H1ZZ28_9ZZZZ